MMKTFSLMSLLIFTFVACNSGNNQEEKAGDTPNQSTQEEKQPSINPAAVENPKTADDPSAKEDPSLPVLSFEKEIYEFPGTIHEGERVKHSFKFTNTGKGDLIIADAKAPCGCTIPSFSKD